VTLLVGFLAQGMVASLLLVGAARSSAAAQVVTGQCFCDAGGTIAVSQLIRAVNVALGKADCPSDVPIPTATASPTMTPTRTPTPSPTATFTPAPLEEMQDTVVDNRTRLEWAKTVGLDETANLYTWSVSSANPLADGTVFSDYLRKLNESTYAGHRDWRLPTSAGSESLPTGEAAEIEELVSCSRTPCLSTAFAPVSFDAFWSASTLSQETSSAWIAVVESGTVVAEGKTNQHGARAVRDHARNCDGEPDGTSCDAGRDGAVRTCVAGVCETCAARVEAEPRFVDNQDGTVTDRGTCLVWERKTGAFAEAVECAQAGDCPDHHDVNNRYTWSESGEDFDGGAATLFLARLNDPQRCFADHCDWRLPELEEPDGRGGLRSIVDCGHPGCVDPIFGPAVTAPFAPHWAGEAVPGTADRAYTIDFSDGDASTPDKTSTAHVRAVRGTPPGSCAGRPDGVTCDAGIDGVVLTCDTGVCTACVPNAVAEPRYVDNGDGSVTDLATCLVWEMKIGTVGTTVLCTSPERCPDPHHVNNAYAWSSSGTGFDGAVKTLFLDRLNDVANGGHSCFADHCDWRLPSQDGLNPPKTGPAELEGLLLMPYPCGLGIELCLDPIFEPAAGSVYWSSTTAAGQPRVAFGINSLTGAVVGPTKTQRAYARAVRGGT
jgi:hypothetical protein